MTAAAAEILARRGALPANPVVLIDGPSGAGKSTLANELVAAWPEAQLVRLDDIYPGWDGLDYAGEHIVDELLEPFRRGAPARWQRYDWMLQEPAEWHPMVVGRPLIIEGCGALGRRSALLADLRIWVDADDVVRKQRALARDHGAFEAFWDCWQQQFEAFVAREDPRMLADVIFDASE